MVFLQTLPMARHKVEDIAAAKNVIELKRKPDVFPY